MHLLTKVVPEVGACVPPRGQERDFGCSPSWIWEGSSNPSSEGNAKPERQMKTKLNDEDTNVDDCVESNVILGFGSNAVGLFSPPRVKSSISDWGELGSASLVLENGSRTKVESPPSRLAQVLSPPPPPFWEAGRGDSGGSTRSAFQNHVRVPVSSRTPSRYPRSSGPNKTYPPGSRNRFPSDAMVTGGMHVRTPDRRTVRGLRELSGEEQHIELRLPPPDVLPRIDEEKREKRHKPPEAAATGAGVNDLNNLSPGSFPSVSGIQSCSSTAGSLSPRTEVLSDSGFPAVCGDYDIVCALEWRLGSDGINEMEAGKTKMDGKGYGNDLGGVGAVDGFHSSRRLSVVSVDGSDNGSESECAGLGGRVGRFTRADVSQDQDTQHGSRYPSLSCSTPGSCADADVDANPQTPVAGSFSAILPRSRCSSRPSDHGSVFGSRRRRHAKDRTMGDVLSPGSRSHLRTVPSLPFTPSEAVLYTYDARAFQDNTKLNYNTSRNASRVIQADEHVHADTQEFDVLRFSSSSPSISISAPASPSLSAPRNLLLGRDRLDEDKDSEAGGSGLMTHLPLNRELRSLMKTDMKSDSDTRPRLNGGADVARLKCDAAGPLTSQFINNRGDSDGSVLRHVDGIEQRDMGGLEHGALGSLGLGGRVSPGSGSVSVSGVSGDSAAGSLFTPVLGGWSYFDDDDIRSITVPGSRTASIQPRSIDRGDREGSEECGLLKSLLESSDPWGLMKKAALGLPSPTPSKIERREKRKEEDVVRVRGSLGRRGVGYVTPPSMDALLGMAGSCGEVEVEVEGCRDDDEDLYEVLDFRSSQPRTDHSSFRSDMQGWC